jgi:hypothetical protein
VAFYDATLQPLGFVRVWSSPSGAGYGEPGGPDRLALFPHPEFQGELAAGPGFHLALFAPSQAAVRAFHLAALAAGGVDQGAPGLRPQYGADYFAAFVLDLDGHKLEAKWVGPKPVHGRSESPA